MAVIFKKMDRELMENYLNNITIKCETNMKIVTNPVKVSDSNFIIPTIKSCNDLINNKYNLTQLKQIAKHYKLKLCGNRQQINNRIYCFLYLSSYIIKIQTIFRRKLVYKYKSLRGPASIRRKICTNSNDFISMEPLEEIHFNQFMSYKDADRFIYGFDINSLHNLFLKSDEEIKNPYNRKIFPNFVFKNIKTLVRISKILKLHINLIYEDDTKNVSFEKAIELRTVSLFQNIDSLGNYSNINWFSSLNRNNLIHFIIELKDIWKYRAQLTPQVKRNVCPPIGDPFSNLSVAYLHSEPNVWNIKKVLLEVMEKLVNTGIDKDSKCLGAYYVLGALTLVNSDAASALPWLFQSVSY
jgi:hypothetical protein